MPRLTKGTNEKMPIGFLVGTHAYAWRRTCIAAAFMRPLIAVLHAETSRIWTHLSLELYMAPRSQQSLRGNAGRLNCMREHGYANRHVCRLTFNSSAPTTRCITLGNVVPSGPFLLDVLSAAAAALVLQHRQVLPRSLEKLDDESMLETEECELRKENALPRRSTDSIASDIMVKITTARGSTSLSNIRGGR